MPIADNDPRVFFAAERTLLAWLRTGLTVMALGFVIARFGLFLQLLALQAPAQRPHASATFSALLGIAFVLAGALASLVATIQHRRFVATLPQADLPRAYSGAFGVAFGFFMAAVGLILAAYLGVSES
jgi:putative membrane protein